MLDIEELAQSGQLFDDQYALIRPLSVDGATADVWLALDTNTVNDDVDLTEVMRLSDSDIERVGLVVAIKIYRPQNALDIEGEQRFRKEYMIVFNCIHTNLIRPTYFAVFRETPYLVLPYCRQGSSELLVGSLTEKNDIWKYLFDVASGLDYLHTKKDIVHLDMKPANVLIVDRGNYAITDFGISTVYNKNYSDDDEVSGTTAYMAPERFQTDYKPTAPSDIWALGATLFELITGTVPFGEEGGAGQTEGRQLPPFPAHLPQSILRVITDCLHAEPQKRPTARQLMELSERQLKHGTPDTVKEDGSKPRPDIRMWLAVGAAAVILGAGALIAMNMSGGSGESSAEEGAQVSVEPQKTEEEEVKPVPLPDDVIRMIASGQQALEQGQQFLDAHPDMINSENGLGEDYYLEAYGCFTQLSAMNAVSDNDSVNRLVADGMAVAERHLSLFLKELSKISESPLPMVSDPAKKRIEKINDVLNNNQE